eukprot:GHVL01005191.1.p1 GENE.GHVL01005191.1~~GHVL01005191.1.p1  ORF type:complete len:243 (-),score=51.03 GHVL01005191.1:338-1066(-)
MSDDSSSENKNRKNEEYENIYKNRENEEYEKDIRNTVKESYNEDSDNSLDRYTESTNISQDAEIPYSNLRSDFSNLSVYMDIVQNLPKYENILLNHSNNTTLILEKYLKSPMSLFILSQNLKIIDSTVIGLRRTVILKTKSIAASFGILDIDFTNFQNLNLKSEIIQGNIPFGKLLNNYSINRKITVKNFWRIDTLPPSLACQFYGEACPAYGRNVEMELDGFACVNVLEIINPNLSSVITI